jgi:hypothetical protein
MTQQLGLTKICDVSGVRKLVKVDIVASLTAYDDDDYSEKAAYNPYAYASGGAQFQQQQQANVAQPPAINPLLKQASTASIGILFGLLSWRSMTAYEMADGFRSKFLRMVTVCPSVLILLLNLFGFLVNLVRPLNFKNHLKFILVVNIVREFVESGFNLVKIIGTNSRSLIPREIYFGRLFMNAWWLLLTMSISKSRWVDNQTAAAEIQRRQAKGMYQ